MVKTLTYCVLIFWAGFVKGATVEVCNTCKNQELRSALTSVERYDSIFVRSGTYTTVNLEITKPVTILGEEGAILDANQEGEILIIHSDSVHIIGLTLRGVPMSYTKDWAAISSDGVEDCSIENNQILNTFFGMYIRKSKKFSIKNNVVMSSATEEITSGNAIHLWYCDSMLIENNEVRNHRDGIYFEFVKRSLIKDNVSEGNVRYGLHFMFSDDDIYLNNTFENNGSGVAVMYGTNIEMTHNTFINNWGPASYGLLLKEIKDGKIHYNKFIKNTTAIYGEGALRMDIRNNTFEANGWAMKVLSSCMENTVIDNVFNSNSFSVFTNSPRNYNVFKNNYWSEYSGYDLDRDGFGDIPHRPVSLFTYIVEQCEPALLLMRSNFIGLLELAEKAAPAITPETLVDEQPRMKPQW